MTIAVTGGDGTIGRALREFLPDARYLSRRDCDITNDRQLAEVFGTLEPGSTVIHAAAVTDHQHPDAGQVIETNVIGTERVARYCRAFGMKLVYLSTHYVYPGETGDYRETDETRPIGAYAWSKLAGEGWARLPDEWLIIRGSWYTPEKVQDWARKGALVDARCNRETPRKAASKITNLILHGATGIYNIGGERRTFADIVEDNGIQDYRRNTRSAIKGFGLRKLSQESGGFEALPPPPYPFPADSSVNVDKYRTLVGSL